MAPGRKTGGRKKGVPNKVTAELRAVFQRAVDKQAAHLGDIIDETRFGIEIEKQMPDGTTVVGRLNADPKGAGDLIAKFSEFCVPKLGRMEHTGEGGGAITIEIKKYGEGE